MSTSLRSIEDRATQAPRVRERRRAGHVARSAGDVGSQRPGTLGELVDIAAIEPDGLIVTTRGVYVRVAEVQRVPNVISSSPDQIFSTVDGWATLCSSIPDFQGLNFYAQTDPMPIADAMQQDVDRVDAAIADDLANDRGDTLPRARRRLLAAQRQSVTDAAHADQPAVASRYWVAVPYVPELSVTQRFRRNCTPPSRDGTELTSWEEHQTAARASLHYTQAVLGHLTGMGMDAHLMGPLAVLATVWERLHPAAAALPDLARFSHVARIVQATTGEEAVAHRHDIIRAVCGDDVAPAAVTAAEDRRWLRHADGTLEETLHLATPPESTSPWWLSLLGQVGLPSTIAVHVHVGDRARTRAAQKRRWARLRASIRYKERRDRLVGHDETDALDEAAQLDAEAAASHAAGTVYSVSVYASIRHPGGDENEFDAVVAEARKQFESMTGASVLRGHFLGARGLASTLPLGTDRLAATRLYGHRNIGHCVPLQTAHCGAPEGPIVGYSDPGGQMTRINAYDAINANLITLVNGKGGNGKSVTMNMLLMQLVAQGMRGVVIDNSTTLSEDGTRIAGHYDPLVSLLPGARRVQIGTEGGDVICPWDVPDPARVTSHKRSFLVALHALLIGELVGQGRHLTSLEESLLLTAIDAVYTRCAQTGERPREALLIQQLAGDERISGDSSIADTLKSLCARLAPYDADGPLAHIADAVTTVPTDPPLLVFDLAGAGDRLTPALVLTIVDRIESVVQVTRTRRVARGVDGKYGAWARRMFLVIEEGWRLSQTPAAGHWLNEYAVRSRHYAVWLFFVTQFFRHMDTPQGRALLDNSTLQLCFRTERADLELARDSLGLTETDIGSITSLVTRKGQYAEAYLMGPRGRGRIRIVLGDLAYWTCSNDPERDQPVRAAALDDADGDPWQALRLLCTPEWHAERDAAS